MVRAEVRGFVHRKGGVQLRGLGSGVAFCGCFGLQTARTGLGPEGTSGYVPRLSIIIVTRLDLC